MTFDRLMALFGSSPAVDRLKALELARQECERREWPWTEPVLVRRTLGGWRIKTNADARGGNVNITIGATGTIRVAAFARY